MDSESGATGADTLAGPIVVDWEQLDRFRRAAGWSQRELAERSGLSTGHISRILRGESGVSVKGMVKLLAAFDNRLTPGELLADVDTQQPPSGRPGGGC